jgi:hypothetical protein
LARHRCGGPVARPSVLGARGAELPGERNDDDFGFFRKASTGYAGAGHTTAADTDNWTNCNDTNSAGVCFVKLADDRTVNLSFE